MQYKTGENDHLKKGDVKLVEQFQCHLEYEAANYPPAAVTDVKFCADSDKGENIFYGDSGGPAVVNGELVGVASAVGGYTDPDLPGIFTRIDVFYDWINGYINSV